MVRTFTRLVVAAAMTAALSSSAAADRFQAGLTTTGRWLSSSSVDALTADDLHAFGELSLGVRLGAPSGAGLGLLAVVSWEATTVSGTSFQRIDSETDLDTWHAGARAERALAVDGRLSGYGRAGLGLSRARVELRDRYGGAATLSDTAWGASGQLAGGLELEVVRLRRGERRLFGLAVRAEAGYFLARPLAMVAGVDHPDDGTLRLPTAAASLGDLDLSGWTFRLGVAGRF